VQIKLWQYGEKSTAAFPRPVQKFIRQMLFGILKSGSVQLNSIGRSLQEPLALKKVTQRLSAHLDKPGLWQEITTATLQTQAALLRKCRFVIVDLSDVTKKYAQRMEGLATVYDGSKGKTAQGYWLCNVTAVNDDATLVVPAYSELFSHRAEVTSENKKILQAAAQVMPEDEPDKVGVYDRGGDRLVLLEANVQADRQCIVRQTARRHLWYKGKKRSFAYLTRRTERLWAYRVKRLHKNKPAVSIYDCGAIAVRLRPNGKVLWLVTMKKRNGGYCWLLCYFKACASAPQAVALALKGYGLRWKIEEVHRQIKTDYQYEAIRLQRYEALKTMNALLWMAVSFLYTRLETLAQEIINHIQLGLRNRKLESDLWRFKFYKLALAFKRIMALSQLYDKITFPTPSPQMALPFSEPSRGKTRL
jgi:hypothetical protein